MTALIGREDQFKEIEEHLGRWLNEEDAMCLFVNGVPGTGKTATVNEVVKKLQQPQSEKKQKGRAPKRKLENTFKYIYVNCHGLTKSLELCTTIMMALTNGKLTKKLTNQSALNDVEAALLKSKALLVLDEMDSLKVMGSALFNRVFQWPTKSDGNVFIIGISNVLNIVESCLPRKCAILKPKTVTFKAYSSQQITEILMDRLKSRMAQEETKAIELCAKKVASMTGDVRRAFTLADSMINMRPPDEQREVGLSTPRKGQRVNDENMPPTTPTTPRTPASACRDAIKLFNQVEASPMLRVNLPFQPKFILACIISIFSKDSVKGKAQTVTKQQVFDVCERVAKKLKLESCPPEGIKEGLELLDMQSLISIGKDKKIRVPVQASMARAVIGDSDLIARINEISL